MPDPKLGAGHSQPASEATPISTRLQKSTNEMVANVLTREKAADAPPKNAICISIIKFRWLREGNTVQTI